MVRCEYLTIDLANLPARTDEVDALNEAGEQGWELIAIMSDHVAYLRRQVDSDNLADGPADRSDRGAAAGRGVIASRQAAIDAVPPLTKFKRKIASVAQMAPATSVARANF